LTLDQVGLGTDVSGGFSVSILNTIRDASTASKIVAMSNLLSPVPQETINSTEEVDKKLTSPSECALVTCFANQQLPIETLFYLATLGGAQVCNLYERTGSFSPGKSFDALLVDVTGDKGALGLWGMDAQSIGGSDSRRKKLEENLERFLFCGDDRHILKVFVQGRCVGGKLFRK